MTSKNLLNPLTLPNIENKTIFLDTNALVEGHKSPEAFAELLVELTDHGCDLTAIEAVRIEFLSDNRNKSELAKKIEFYNTALTTPEMPSKTFEQNFSDSALLYAFGRQAHAFKAVDFMIAAAMKKYAKKVLLLTNDHNDFTTQLFDLQEILPLAQSTGRIVPFGLYSFSEEKYATLIGEQKPAQTESTAKIFKKQSGHGV
jgi:predicted nucleic acid-binding protein